MASELYNHLVKQIKEFEDSLDNAEEVGICLVNFGQTITFSLQSIAYANPSLIIYHGNSNGNNVRLIQHISQTSILLMKFPRSEPEKPRNKIGFIQEV